MGWVLFVMIVGLIDVGQNLYLVWWCFVVRFVFCNLGFLTLCWLLAFVLCWI